LYLVDRHHLLKYGTSAYNEASDEYYNATIGRLTRYTASRTTNGYSIINGSRKVFIGETKSTGIPVLSVTHGVGTLLFGTDGTLLVSCGEGASPGEDAGGNVTNSYAQQGLADGIISTQEDVGAFRSQLLEALSGKILRLDPETGDGIPSNPFFDGSKPRSARSRTYALGLRNPFRMTLKPSTGSTDKADGNPGTLYVGDVGSGSWEELNVVSKPGMNFGWPFYEGLENGASSFYDNANVVHPYAPNPLYGSNGCTQPNFYFRDLFKQATASGNVTFTNPCNTAQLIPSTIKTFMHSRPILDWYHWSANARTGIFNGETAAVANIGAGGSPVSGTQFKGSASVGGVFYTGNDFPAEYKGTYFHGDYGAGWIKNISVDANNKPVAVKNFIDAGAVVVAMATHPLTGGLYYIHYGSEVRKINYGANRPPVAVATADKMFGPSPLPVQFTGGNSTDPEGLALSYEWNFGDGSAVSTEANPLHTFKAASGQTTTYYTVVLKVKDNTGLVSTASLSISVNNTPPTVAITSPVDNGMYSVANQTVINLKATVSDKEHSADELSYQWQTILHHNDHTHPGPIDTKTETSTTLTPQGCDGETYFYRIVLIVTDAAGLATTKEVNLYPDCSTKNQAPTVSITSPAMNATYTSPANVVLIAEALDTDGTVSKVEFYNGTTKMGEDLTEPYSYSWNNVAAGKYAFSARAVDNQGAHSTLADVTILVNAPINQLPTVDITSPANNSTFVAPASITVTAHANDGDGTVSKVEFYNGATKLGEASTVPYSFSWSNVAIGNYQITTKVFDNTGASANSTAVSIAVKAPNQAPTVRLTSPANNASFTAPANVVLTAEALDTDGSVSKVEFYNGTTKMGEDLTEPYSYTWNNVAAGKYTFSARAIDNQEARSTSAIVDIAVKEAGPSVVSFTLVDAKTEKDIAPLTEGYIIDFSTLGTKHLNIRANTSPSAVGSVVFNLDGKKENTDNTVPYAIKGNNGNGKGNVYNPWTPSIGFHTLTATPYLATNAGGITGTPLTVRFNVIDSGKKGPKNARSSNEEEELAMAGAFIHAYPNPFYNQLTIEFSLTESEDQAKVELYDAKGSLVETLFRGKAEANYLYTMSFHTNSHRSGLYFIRVITSKTVYYKKVNLLK
jgi:glucose/arabinose dehydrogenase